MRPVVPCLLLVGALLAGCGGADTTADDGHLLRFSPSEGDSRAIRMRMDMTMRMTLGGEEAPVGELPVTVMTLDVTVDEVSDVIGLSFGYRGLELTGGDPEARSAMEQAMAGLADVRGTARMSPRGEMLDSSLDVPDTLDPMLAGFMEQFEGQLDQLAVALPEERVEVGDSWTQTVETDVGGIGQTVEVTNTLIALDGDDYSIETAVTQTVRPGPLEGPGGQVVGEVLGGESTGSGRLEGTLAFPMATHGEVTTSGSTRMLVEGMGEQEFLQEIDLTMVIEPAG